MKCLVLIIVVLFLCSCTDSSRSKLFSHGDEFTIELLGCSGDVVRTWTSTGKVKSEANSDGYFFMNKSTGKLVEVTGTLIIRQN
tara:strand:- start:921 stop:1172 length:252 start_codon:yes stop_codon:yes gene_type:complete